MASPYRNIYFQLYFTQKIYSDQNGNFHFGQLIGGIEKKGGEKRKRACVKQAMISKIVRKCHLAKQLSSPQFTSTQKGVFNIHKCVFHMEGIKMSWKK